MPHGRDIHMAENDSSLHIRARASGFGPVLGSCRLYHMEERVWKSVDGSVGRM